MIVQARFAVIAATALAFALGAPTAFAQQSGASDDSGSRAMHESKDSAMSHSDTMAHPDKMKGSTMARSGTSEGSAMSHDGDTTTQ